MGRQNDFYAVLGLTPDASAEEIRRAYHFAARRLHPDTRKEAKPTEFFLRIQEAYEVLGSPTSRSRYDAAMAGEPQAEADWLPVARTIQVSRPVLPRIDEAQLVYVLVKMAAISDALRGGAMDARQQLNVALVLDRSTSMQGERMDTAKAAAIDLVRQLRPDDILSIITFGDRADVLLPATRQSEIMGIENQIQMVHTGGGTEIFRGLEAAFLEVRRNLNKAFTNHMVLLTDGRTYGDENLCLQLAAEAARLGVGISGLGIGNEWNDKFLDDLAVATGGSSEYVAEARGIRNYLVEKFRKLNEVFAEQVSLSLTPTPGVELRSVFRIQPDATPLTTGCPILLGSLPKTVELAVLMELEVAPLPEDTERLFLAFGEVAFQIPSFSTSAVASPLRVVLPVRADAPEEQPPREIVQALSRVTLYRLQEQAQSELDAGQVEKASQHLRYLAENLLAQGQGKLARTVKLEAERITAVHSISDEGKKRMKYGTRALLLPSQTPGGEE